MELSTSRPLLSRSASGGRARAKHLAQGAQDPELQRIRQARKTLTKPRLYRENFTPEECQELDRSESLSAVSELCVLRILLARVLKALRKIKPTLEHHFKNLVIFSQVGATMASLARFQHKRDGHPPDPFLTELALMDGDPL